MLSQKAFDRHAYELSQFAMLQADGFCAIVIACTRPDVEVTVYAVELYDSPDFDINDSDAYVHDKVLGYWLHNSHAAALEHACALLTMASADARSRAA